MRSDESSITAEVCNVIGGGKDCVQRTPELLAAGIIVIGGLETIEAMLNFHIVIHA